MLAILKGPSRDGKGFCRLAGVSSNSRNISIPRAAAMISGYWMPSLPDTCPPPILADSPCQYRSRTSRRIILP